MNLVRFFLCRKIMVKLTKRKGFNFFRSYYDVYNELSDKDKVIFMDALLDRQFQGMKPTGLSGMAMFAYISQTNSIDSQVKGYEDKTGNKLTPTIGGAVGGCLGGADTPTVQVEEKEKGKEEVEEKPSKDFVLDSFNEFWKRYPKKVARQKCLDKWKKLKKEEHLKIIRTINTFINYKPFEDYTHPNPMTYLNQSRWEDEFPEPKKAVVPVPHWNNEPKN